MILDLFAGPGGWDVGLRDHLGIDDVLGIELDADACATREAAGLRTLRADVTALDPVDVVLWEPVEGLIASPPCQAWSTAGRRTSREDQERLLRHAMQCREGWKPYDADDYADERTPLVLEPLRWIDALRPAWVAFEQVPPVLDFWRACAYVLREWGYWTWTGVLKAADYGVPQTRRRAFLVADQDGPVGPPEQTHAETPTGLLGPWVTMTQALGWDGTLRPGGGKGHHQGERDPVPSSQPAPTLHFGHQAASWVVTGGETTERYQRRDPESQPAPPITGAGNTYYDQQQDALGSRRITVEQAATLQGFPADHPWQGSKTSCFRQVGDAVPPPLAAAVCKRLVRVSA